MNNPYDVALNVVSILIIVYLAVEVMRIL